MITAIIILTVLYFVFFGLFAWQFHKLEKESKRSPDYRPGRWHIAWYCGMLCIITGIWAVALCGIRDCKNLEKQHQEQTYNVDYFDIVYDSLYVQHNSVKDSTITFKIIEK